MKVYNPQIPNSSFEAVPSSNNESLFPAAGRVPQNFEFNSASHLAYSSSSAEAKVEEQPFVSLEPMMFEGDSFRNTLARLFHSISHKSGDNAGTSRVNHRTIVGILTSGNWLESLAEEPVNNETLLHQWIKDFLGRFERKKMYLSSEIIEINETYFSLYCNKILKPVQVLINKDLPQDPTKAREIIESQSHALFDKYLTHIARYLEALTDFLAEEIQNDIELSTLSNEEGPFHLDELISSIIEKLRIDGISALGSFEFFSLKATALLEYSETFTFSNELVLERFLLPELLSAFQGFFLLFLKKLHSRKEDILRSLHR